MVQSWFWGRQAGGIHWNDAKICKDPYLTRAVLWHHVKDAIISLSVRIHRTICLSWETAPLPHLLLVADFPQWFVRFQPDYVKLITTLEHLSAICLELVVTVTVTTTITFVRRKLLPDLIPGEFLFSFTLPKTINTSEITSVCWKIRPSSGLCSKTIQTSCFLNTFMLL